MKVIGIALALVLTSSPGTDSPASVHVTVVGPSMPAEGLLDALPEFTRELGVPTRFERVEAIELEHIVSPEHAPVHAPAHVWIDLSAPSRARIVIVDGAYERVLIRTVVLPEGLDEVARDEIGYIVEASVKALLGGGQIGIAREAAARELGIAPSPAPATPRRPAAVVEISAGYAARVWGPVTPLHGPLLDLGVGAGLERLDLGGDLELQYLAPVLVEGGPFAVALTGASVRGLVRVDLRTGGRWSFDVSTGGGVDLLHDEGRPRTGEARAFAPTTRVIGDATLRLGPALRVGEGVDRLLVRVEASLDVAIRSYRYVTADTGDLLFDPWPLRPGLRLSVGWTRRAAR